MCIHSTHRGAHPGFRRQRLDKMDPFELVLIFHFNTPSKGKKVRQISVGIKPYYHEILTAVVDLTRRLSTLSIWKISKLKGGGIGFMFVPITLVMRCIWVCSNDSNEKDKMTMCKNRAGISMTRQTELRVWCTRGQRKYKIHDPQQQGQIKENTGLTRCSPWLLKYIWITTLIITLTQRGALLYECYLRSIS